MPSKSLRWVPASTRLPRALVGLVFARKLPFVGELYGFEPYRQRPQVSHLSTGLTFGLSGHRLLSQQHENTMKRCRLQGPVSGKTSSTPQAGDAPAALSFPALNGGACRAKTGQ